MTALTLIVISWLTILALLLALSVVVGRLGIWSVGHLAFFSLGQILLATALTHWQMETAAALLLVALGAGAVATIVGVTTLRLERDYFVILSLALAWSVDAGALALYGVRGVAVEPPLVRVTEAGRAALFLGVPALLTVLAHLLVARTSWSVTLAATRHDAHLAATLGIPTFRIRVGIFTISSVSAALIGGLHAMVQGGTDPALGGVMRSILLFCLLILGGVNSTGGVVASTVVFVSLPRLVEYLLGAVPTASFYAANITQGVFAVATYAVLRIRVAASAATSGPQITRSEG